MLKAKISQVKSNLYAVKTTKYDTTDIELTVETTDSSPWLNPRFELLGIKSDGHEVHQTENFKVVDLNNHIVQVTLDEQFVTCEGNVDLQLLIKDGSRKSSTPFKLYVGRSLDSDILESHRSVKVLDELEKYIIEGREYISEATGLAQSTANYVQAINTQAEANEAQRLQNESQRQSDETKRKEAEDDRKQAEVLRVQNEDTRQSAEVIRVANEQTRLENESNRIERETARENKESIRQTQEQKRHTSESTRQSQEATRQSNEDNRKQAEKSRSQEEIIRINNEATRKQAEDTRNSQELDRQSAESTRRTSETNRNNAESIRTQNENTRKSQETSRITNEQLRVRQEQERINNENTRKTEEAKRVEAEELRKEAYTEATQLLEELRNFEPITENDRTDYMGNQHESLKAKNDADVDWLLGEINTVHYDGQHITATDSIEGRSKSAILKGQTLVNLASDYSVTSDYMAKINHKNIVGKVLIKNIYKGEQCYVNRFDTTTDAYKGASHITSNNFILEVPNGQYIGTVYDNKSVITADELLEKAMIIEYQEGMENWDIPYFEGMKSVQMPVLKATGKNLFDGKILDDNKRIISSGLITNDSSFGITDYIPIESEKFYISNISGGYSNFYDNNKVYISTFWSSAGSLAPNNAKYVRHSIEKTNIDTYMFEQGTQATSYEPYKSNILTVNEPIELCGVGDVKDELNLLTGELTQRVGEMVLDGSDDEIWSVTDGLGGLTYFRIVFSDMIKSDTAQEKLMFDKINVCSYSYLYNSESIPEEIIGATTLSKSLQSQVIYIYYKNIGDVNTFKTYLQQNPITVQYQLATESIKTVGLSDNHVYSYKDATHYDCSSAEGSLVPTLSIDVPTNLSALVSRQRATIGMQKNQIKLLEETNSELIISQETQDEEIVTNMLASVELFEMVLSMTPLSIDMSKSMGVNPMVEVYVTLILKGEKTIEQVPAVIRDKVQAQLDLLTK